MPSARNILLFTFAFSLPLFFSCRPQKPSVDSSRSTSNPSAKTASTASQSIFDPKFPEEPTIYKEPSKQSSFRKELNPTPNPIGGGPGYSDIYSESRAQHTATDLNSLKQALSTAKSGDVIFIPGHLSIDLTGQHFKVPAGVTLASDRGRGNSPGALLYSNTSFHQDSVDSYNDYLFTTGGRNVRFTGLRLRGPSAEIDEFPDRVACGIKGQHGFLEVSNCELSHWLKWAIDLAIARGDRIRHNYIHHTRRAGFGYGIWVRGSDTPAAPSSPEIPLIEANLLENCRHEIASGGQVNSSFIARYNVIARHSMSNHMIDRHHQGAYTEVSNNVIAPSNHLIFHGMAVAPADALVFIGNWCDEKDLKRVFPKYNTQGWNIKVGDNKLGGTWRVHQPAVSLQADVTEGVAPLTVTLRSAGHDPDGYPINAWIWDLEDGRRMRMSGSGTMKLSFMIPGVYTVRVRARNSYGLPSEPASINIIVNPSSKEQEISRRLLAFWDFNQEDEWASDSRRFYELGYDAPEPSITEGYEGLGLMRQQSPKDLVQNPYVSNSHARALQPGTQNFSFCLAFRIDELPEANAHIGLLGYGAGSETEAGYSLCFRNSQPNELCLFFSNGRGKRDRIVIRSGLQEGKWYHLVACVDRKLGLSAYIDGKSVLSQKPVSVGGDDIYHDHHHFGIPGRFVLYPRASIDQAGFWDRVLSAEEAAWLHNQGKGRQSLGI